MGRTILCQPCHDALLRSIDNWRNDIDNEYVGAHKTVESFVAASDLGCVICSALWRPLSPAQRAAVAVREELRENITELNVEASVDRKGQLVGGWRSFATIESEALREVSTNENETCLFVLSPKPLVAEHYNTAPASTSTRSTETWKIALNWVEECCSAHLACSSSKQPSWMPTRLLDVGKFAGEGIVQLIESVSLHQHYHYCTLSHRWGTSLRAKLTMDTARAMAHGISIEQLPRTFQHAIEICQRLGIHYLWIDSLCIYQDQDDKSDWLKEGLLMDQVFTNTFLSIAAAAAMDDSEGLFVDRNPEHELRAPTIFLPSPTTTKMSEFVIIDRKFIHRTLEGAPLNRRGWVLQERVLAPRTLYFGSGQIFWECRQGLLCEKWPQTLPNCVTEVAGLGSFKRLRFDNANIDVDSSKVRYEDNSGLWNMYMSAYSKTSLTFQSDKVIALSGIAKVVAAMNQKEYVAGMWKKDLSHHLLWEVEDAKQVDGTPSLRASSWRAPTWSWLSVDGCIRFGYPRARLLDVVDVDVKCETSDPTGPLIDAPLTLRARLRSLQLKGRQKDSWRIVIDGQDFENAERTFEEPIRLDVKQDNFDEENRQGVLFAITADEWTNGFHYSRYLLVKCVDPARAIYHRIGTAFLVFKLEPERISESLDLGHDENEAAIPCIAYDPQSHVHTIILK